MWLTIYTPYSVCVWVHISIENQLLWSKFNKLFSVFPYRFWDSTLKLATTCSLPVLVDLWVFLHTVNVIKYPKRKILLLCEEYQ